MTQRGEYRCIVKEGASGQPFLVFELLRGDQPSALKGKLISIDLQPGTTIEKAQTLARELDKAMVGLAVT